MKPMRKAIACALLAALLLLCTGVSAEVVPYSAIYTSENPIPAIAKAVRPAIVGILAKQVLWSKEGGEQSFDVAAGSGVYFDERGYVATNYHVVENADAFELTFLDGTKREATLVGGDNGIDVAVLHFDGAIDAQPVPLGDSDALEIGELAIAIGNPGSGENVLFASVTAGIISGLDREEMNVGNFTRLVRVIQTDAAINSGNSGGALLNARGELIGIPTLKYMFGATTIYEGLGFAIPINTARPIIEQLIEKGRVTRPRIGVMVVTIEGPDEPLRNFAPAGAQCQTVEPGGPAARAGLQNFDIIMEIDGLRVKDVNALTGQIDTHAAGDSVHLKVCRYFNPTTAEKLDTWTIFETDIVLEMID